MKLSKCLFFHDSNDKRAHVHICARGNCALSRQLLLALLVIHVTQNSTSHLKLLSFRCLHCWTAQWNCVDNVSPLVSQTCPTGTVRIFEESSTSQSRRVGMERQQLGARQRHKIRRNRTAAKTGHASKIWPCNCLRGTNGLQKLAQRQRLHICQSHASSAAGAEPRISRQVGTKDDLGHGVVDGMPRQIVQTDERIQHWHRKSRPRTSSGTRTSI